MSCSSTPIFIPSCSSSPYVVTSPPPDSPTSKELAYPHKQMIKHIACLLNIEEEEVRRQFPTNRSLLPIDMSSPRCQIEIPDTLLSYPGTKLIGTTNPSYPNSPPIPSPEPLPIPPPHFHDSISVTPPTTSATNSAYTFPVIPAFIEEIPSCQPSPISPMAVVLYQQTEANILNAKVVKDRVRDITHSKNPKPKFSQSCP